MHNLNSNVNNLIAYIYLFFTKVTAKEYQNVSKQETKIKCHVTSQKKQKSFSNRGQNSFLSFLQMTENQNEHMLSI